MRANFTHKRILLAHWHARHVLPNLLRQHGQVSNETELLEFIDERLDDSRLFTVGIGPAPNGSFMRRAAAAGRGTFVFISGTDQVAERMGELLVKLEQPVVTDIEVDHGSAGDAIVWPERVPDLYAGCLLYTSDAADE